MAPVLKKASASAAPAALNLKNAISGQLGDMVAGGLVTDFDGTVVEARTVIWNYDNGQGPKVDDGGNPILTLACRLTIKRDEEDESDVVNYWSLGDPTQFAPSMDGESPSPVNDLGLSEGICLVAIGQRNALKNNTNYAQALEALLNAGFPSAKISADYRFWEGLYAHWDRIPQKKRSGMVSQTAPTEGRRSADSLVPTVIKKKGEAAAAAPKAPPAARPAGSPPVQSAPTPAPSGGDLDDKLAEIVVAALPTDGTALKKGALAPKVLKAANLTPAERAKGVPRATSADFLNLMQESGLLVFDADAGELYAVPPTE